MLSSPAEESCGELADISCGHVGGLDVCPSISRGDRENLGKVLSEGIHERIAPPPLPHVPGDRRLVRQVAFDLLDTGNSGNIDVHPNATKDFVMSDRKPAFLGKDVSDH
jgi:hypothetical protein